MKLLLAELIPVVLLMLIPLSVHAGFFASLVGMMAEEQNDIVIDESPDQSAQYTPLLSAILNSDPQGATGGGDIFVYEEALVSTGPVGEDEIKASPNSGGEISVYVVRPGDALSQIAEMYGVTTNTILWANDISKASSIQPGDSLVILPIVGVRHTVKKGDTMSTIAKKYDADVEEILSYNQVASIDDLAVGDELMIPGGEIEAPVRVASRPTPTKSSGSASGGGGFINPAPGSKRSQGIHGYNGVDLAGAHGSAIYAAAAGEVIVAKAGGWNGGYGTYVVVRHGNGTQTLYAHLSSISVAQGAYVAQGSVIGGMGSTGRSTGTHLHFEVRGGSNPF